MSDDFLPESPIKIEGDPDIRFYIDEKTEEVWFAVNDVIASLVDTTDPVNYLKNMRRRDEGLSTIWKTLVERKPIQTRGGQQRLACATLEGVFRIVQSVPSPRVEPVKQWLAEIGAKQIGEARRVFYRRQGYTDSWIDQREAGRLARNMLTQEWSQRGIEDGRDFASLTTIISRGAFNLTVSQYKELKGLGKDHSLRDHMSVDELAVQMIGDIATRRAAQAADAQGFKDNAAAARKGGAVAGKTRRQLEDLNGQPVVTPRNFIDKSEADYLLEDVADQEDPEDDVPF
jgi:DNA-damage-inducible protein D